MRRTGSTGRRRRRTGNETLVGRLAIGAGRLCVGGTDTGDEAMKTYDAPNGTQFEYADELEGYVYVKRGGTESHIHGGDLLSFFKHLMDECAEEVEGAPI